MTSAAPPVGLRQIPCGGGRSSPRRRACAGSAAGRSPGSRRPSQAPHGDATAPTSCATCWRGRRRAPRRRWATTARTIFRQPSAAAGACPALPFGRTTRGAFQRPRGARRRGARGPGLQGLPGRAFGNRSGRSTRWNASTGGSAAQRRGRHPPEPRRGRRLIGAVLAGQRDELAAARRNMTMVMPCPRPGRGHVNGGGAARCCQLRLIRMARSDTNRAGRDRFASVLGKVRLS